MLFFFCILAKSFHFINAKTLYDPDHVTTSDLRFEESEEKNVSTNLA